MYKIKIQNNNRELVLSFSNSNERQVMVDAINNCLDDETKYPSIFYHDKKDSIILSAKYLKNSLIVLPNPL